MPPEQSRRVAEAAPQGRFVTVAAEGHNDPALLDGPEILDEVLAFFEAEGLGGGSPGAAANEGR